MGAMVADVEGPWDDLLATLRDLWRSSSIAVDKALGVSTQLLGTPAVALHMLVRY